MLIKLIVPGTVKGKARPRFNTHTGRAYTPDSTVTYENYIKTLFITENVIKPLAEYKGALKVKFEAYMDIPVSKSNKQQQMMASGAIYHKKKPDADNILKLCDALNKIAWWDDSQIVEAQVLKQYSTEPRLEITIEYLDLQF